MTTTWDFYKSFGVYKSVSWFRLWNFLIDTAIPYLLFYVLINSITPRESIAQIAAITLLNFLFFPIQFVYFLLMEGLTGKTLGKYVTGTSVVKANGEKATFVDILIRQLVRHVLYLFTILSFVLNRDTTCPTALHDWLSGTRVVDDPGIVR